MLRLVLAVVIATGGIAADSTAVIIGAMLIAPLMSPMIGLSLASVMGLPRAAVRTLAITAAGTLLSIAVAALVAAIIPVNVDTGANAEVLSRVSPRMVDLIIALAAGLTAAVSVVREDIPDAIPGIAISASIVPPLCVVGVSLLAGDMQAASGAFLLFFANFFAIQTMCGVTFVVMGLGRRARSATGARARRIWYGAVALGVALVAVPLALSSLDVIENDARDRAMRQTATEWLAESDYRLRSMRVSDSGTATIEVAGQGEPPSLEAYREDLEQRGIEPPRIRMVVLDEYVLER